MTNNDYDIDRPDSQGAAADGLTAYRPLSTRSRCDSRLGSAISDNFVRPKGVNGKKDATERNQESVKIISTTNRKGEPERLQIWFTELID